MPVLAVPPRAVEAGFGPAVEADVPLLHMPAQAELLPLQPSKLAVYKLFTEQVRTHYKHQCVYGQPCKPN